MSETLNNFFAETFTNEDSSLVPDPVNFFEGDDSEKLKDVIFTPELFHKHLLKLKPNKDPGPGGFGSNMLKDLSEELSVPLSMLIL